MKMYVEVLRFDLEIYYQSIHDMVNFVENSSDPMCAKKAQQPASLEYQLHSLKIAYR